jgi:2-keto-4-pentenoate hydratase/2-oxohepta-3-ene-1,7-dioic acid hydratase in catechol pathway
MKIIGFVGYNGERRKANGEWEMVLKGDSCLLNNRKPFFTPEGATTIGVTPCIVLRVSRLGKGIAKKFAERYYDAIAPGVDFADLTLLREAQEQGKPWTEAIGFDYSLAIGKWATDKEQWATEDLLLSPEEAIAQASKIMTIRQGDLIYIQKRQAPRPVQREEILRVEKDGEEQLYCKIK